MAKSIDDSIAELEALSASALRDRWLEAFGNPAPPRASRDLLLRALAYRTQERAEGGLSKAALRHLTRLAKGNGVGTELKLPPAAHLKPGSRLVREWRGVVHEVFVLDDGFDYRGEQHTSLSRIALRITGTPWSGPLFFGLRKARARFKRDRDGQ